MAEGRTPIVVALIGTAGVLGAALIANADKLFGSRAEPAASEAAIGEVRPEPSARRVKSKDEPSEDRAPLFPDIGGEWRDDDGYRFAFIQSGPKYSFVQYKEGRPVGGGEGTLAGRGFSHRFRADGVGEGSCTGSVAADGQTSSGQCRADDGGEWSFTVRR